MELIIIIILSILLVILISYVLFGSKKSLTDFDVLMQSKLENFRKDIQEAVFSSRKEMTEAREDMNKQSNSTLRFLIEMQSTVEKIINQQEQANKLGESLKDILATPKMRGNYGELIMEELLEKTLPKGMWERQFKISQGCIVDGVIKYKDLYVPIDSKFPRDNYLKYLETEKVEEKAMHWKLFERDVIDKIKEISKYIQPSNGTADFALMFIPSEAIYYETISEKNYLGNSSKIMDEAQKYNVIPVSPNNFYAFLQVVLTGMRNLEVLSQAREIQMKLTRLNESFDMFYKHHETIGKELEKASDAYRKGDKHINRFRTELEDTLAIECVNEEKESD